MEIQDIKELDVNKITNEIIDTIRNQYENEIKVLHTALALATLNCDNYWEEKIAIKNGQSLYDYFIEQAKNSIDEDRD